MVKPIIIDTDPGIDDVVAITAALFSEQLDVKLITTIGGNVGIENTTRNALDLVHALGKTTPIAKGVDQPLLNKLETAEGVHGRTGIGTYQFEIKERPTQLLKENAIIHLKEAILKSQEPVTLVPIGPLTNIALVLKLYPEVEANISEIILMGGAAQGGNVTPFAEFNIYVDPHAAKIVFDSGLPIVMCGLDVTRMTHVTQNNVDKVRTYGKIGQMIADILGDYHSTIDYVIHDLCTIFYLESPELFKTEQAKVQVITEGEAMGHTLVHYQADGHVKVCVGADVDAFRSKFEKTFEKIKHEGM